MTDVNRRAHDPPLYDPGFEHDACGVGFVADAGGGSRGRVLPLALAGLAALGHRGAFASDGASSDGAGLALPLERSVLRLIAAGVGERAGRQGVVVLFLPRGRAGRIGREVAADALADEGLAVAAWRPVPIDPSALGPVAAASRPDAVQAIVVPAVGGSTARGSAARGSAGGLELALLASRRRMEVAARAAGLADFAVPSASTRLVVYKGLVAGDRLAAFYPDLAGSLPLSHAVFHQRYATNTHPVWRLAQPFRRLAHNGEIDTVRGNREHVRGRAADPATSPAARRISASGPLLSPDASDSLSLDEAVELLEATGWDLFAALLALVPEAAGMRVGARPAEPLPGGDAGRLHDGSLAAAHAARVAGFLAAWDGPGAFVASDGRRVGALLDRNGLRPLAFAVTRSGVVAAASEAGAVPLAASETIRRGRLGPGELLLVDPGRGLVLEDEDARTEALRRSWLPSAPRPPFADRPLVPAPVPGPIRYLAGLDAERHRLHLRTMVLDAHEPLWSMGDDTPTPGLGRVDRPVTDHLRQAFAQVTNPPIDPERERSAIDLAVTLGRRPALLGGPPDPRAARTLRLARPFVADLPGLLSRFAARARLLDATWPAAAGPGGLSEAVDRLAIDAVSAARQGAQLLVVSDATMSPARPPVPSVLAVGAVHAALTAAGLRGRADVAADAGDVLDVHAAAMVLAAGATVVHPRIALAAAADLAGGRGAEELTPETALERLLDALEAGLRKTLARMGIGVAASYVGGGLVETVELSDDVLARCLPAAVGWPGSVGFEAIAERLLRRADVARPLAADLAPNRLPDPGLARFRSDGEHHGYAPATVGAVQALARSAGQAQARPAGHRNEAPAGHGPAAAAEAADTAEALARYRAALARAPATVREQLSLRRARRPVPLAEVEPASAIVRRFVASAMSVGALSPEAHRAVTIGMQRAGGAANTGEGGEDPGWYAPGPDGERLDARIKQVASGRFGVSAAYLARADQLEIKIAQGSKPGEGGQLPGRKATAYIAALRHGQTGQAYISPPPHHDIYSIEDLAQLVADLRAVTPRARVGVKLVATRGIGTIAAGVAKAGADYVHVAGHAGGTGASPLASIKHVGAPWELGLAEVHQVLLRNGLRDRVALRTDGGLRTGRDVLVAALLGAEEFAFGTALLVAIGCDMARQCHLDTCPTGIATQRDDLRAKFAGSPEQVERFVVALAEDVRRELALAGARSIGELVGEARRWLRPAPGATLDLAGVVGAPRWDASAGRRERPDAAARVVERIPASTVQDRVVGALRAGDGAPTGTLAVTTAERSFGAALSGAVERGELGRGARLRLAGAAGQSLGAFMTTGVALRLEGVANDYVAKGLSGGTVVVAPEPDLAAAPERNSIVGNTCLFGATAGRLHVVGRAGMRFAVRNSGADAVVEGIGPHGCEYMTGGTVVVLGPVGANFGAGMTGGRAYLWDPEGSARRALDHGSVGAIRLADACATREDGAALSAAFRALVRDHAAAGSGLATHLLAADGPDPSEVWVVEPAGAATPATAASATAASTAATSPLRPADRPAEATPVATVPQPRRPRAVPDATPVGT